MGIANSSVIPVPLTMVIMLDNNIALSISIGVEWKCCLLSEKLIFTF